MAKVICGRASHARHTQLGDCYGMVRLMFVFTTSLTLTHVRRMYQLFVEGWGDPSYYTSASWLLASDPMVCGIVACMVQLFFAWRLHIISKKPLLTAFIVTASVATLAGGVGTGIAVLWVREYALLGRVKAIGCTWDFSAVIADVTITIGMTYYLRRHKGSFDSTDHLLDRIIQRECIISRPPYAY